MTSFRRLRATLRRAGGLFLRSRREREMAAELDSHLQMHIDDAIRRGLPLEQARRDALARFGPMESIKEDYRDRGSLPPIDVLVQDLRSSVRVLRRYPGLTCSAAAILAFGVGANTAMFSMVDALMFRPPAGIREPERVVDVDARNFPSFRELRARSGTLQLAARTDVQDLSLGLGPAAEPIATACVTADYFRVLGAPPALGRAFAELDEAPGTPRTVVLSHGFWTRRYARSERVLDQVLTIAGHSHRVIGVAQAAFRGADLAPVDAWILLPLSPEACSFTGTNLMASTSGGWLRTIGRLREGAALAEAEAETAALLRDEDGAVLEPLDAGRRARLARDGRLAIWLAAGAALVLLIACANVAGLLAVRAIERRREIAVRLQLGASRARVLLQLLIENLLLGALCAAASAAVAFATARLLARFFPIVRGDSLISVRGWWLLAGMAMAAALVSGLVPALRAVNAGLTQRPGTSQFTARARTGGRTALLVAQIAVALMLVTAAGLFARSVANARANLGYDLDRVVIATIDLQRAGIRRQADIRATFDLLLARVRALPQVEHAALTSRPPLGAARSTVVTPEAPGRQSRHINLVSTGYFDAMGTRIVRGRSFLPSDDAAGPPVVVIDEAIAADQWPGEDPVGRCLEPAFGAGCVEVIGVAEQRRYGRLTRPDLEIYYPLAQRTSSSGVPQALLVRTLTPHSEAVPAIVAVIQSASVSLPAVSVRPLEALADVQARSWRLGAAVFGLFGAFALVLAVVGIYASLSFSVRQRTREIGLRMALGAERGSVLAMIVREGLTLALIGWAIGGASAFAASRFIRSLLFNVEPGDAANFALASAVLIGAALLGCLVPAAAAARVQPSIALRQE